MKIIAMLGDSHTWGEGVGADYGLVPPAQCSDLRMLPFGFPSYVNLIRDAYSLMTDSHAEEYYAEKLTDLCEIADGQFGIVNKKSLVIEENFLLCRIFLKAQNEKACAKITVDGKLYSLTNGISTMGVFYNTKVLEDNGWEVPATIEDMEKIMDEAMEKGLYASVTGNKGWQPVNENYASLFLTHVATPDTVYKCLTGEESWENDDVKAAVEKSKEWWDKGYLAGDDYVNLNFSESLQLLADEKAPFFIGPSIAFQWAASFFTEDKTENIAFIPFPATEEVPEETYTLGAACTLSINANVSQEHKDEAAKIIDIMMSPEFTQEMTTAWPGYWGTPLRDLSSVDTSEMGYLSKSFMEVVQNVSEAVEKGNFGFYDNVFFPADTQQRIVNIDEVWFGTTSVDDYVTSLESAFKEEFDKGLVPPIPKPAGIE